MRSIRITVLPGWRMLGSSARETSMVCRFLGYAAMGFMLGACNGEIYLRDGVTDGDTFYLAERALHDPDPVLQSWVGYSLAKSTCQLRTGEENPARATSFDCELTAREHLLERWSELRERPGNGSEYLNELAEVREAGFLREYVWHFLRERDWSEPAGLEPDRFEEWREGHLADHEPVTKLIGAWGYSS